MQLYAVDHMEGQVVHEGMKSVGLQSIGGQLVCIDHVSTSEASQPNPWYASPVSPALTARQQRLGWTEVDSGVRTHAPWITCGHTYSYY